MFPTDQLVDHTLCARPMPRGRPRPGHLACWALAAALMLLALSAPTGAARAEGIASYLDPAPAAGEAIEGAEGTWLSIFSLSGPEFDDANMARTVEVSTFTLREIAVAALVIAVAAIGALVGLAFYDSDESRLRR